MPGGSVLQQVDQVIGVVDDARVDLLHLVVFPLEGKLGQDVLDIVVQHGLSLIHI